MDALLCPLCAGPLDPATGECIEHRDLMEALGRHVRAALDLAEAEQAALAGQPLPPFWPGTVEVVDEQHLWADGDVALPALDLAGRGRWWEATTGGR
jgi:hypothetical protein